MSTLTNVNPQVVDAVNLAQQATLKPDVIMQSGAGKAYQSVAQSTALAVQDATDYLRNVNTIATTAMGVAMAQLLAGENTANATTILTQANTLTTEAAANYLTIGQNAASVLTGFPSGSSS